MYRLSFLFLLFVFFHYSTFRWIFQPTICGCGDITPRNVEPVSDFTRHSRKSPTDYPYCKFRVGAVRRGKCRFVQIGKFDNFSKKYLTRKNQKFSTGKKNLDVKKPLILKVFHSIHRVFHRLYGYLPRAKNIRARF